MPRTSLESRRRWLQGSALSLASLPVSGWMPALAAAAAQSTRPNKSCILLWLNGGASTIDLWDVKPGHAYGGPTRAIDTAAPGLCISEHLPQLAAQGQRLAVIRSMSTKEGDHGRGTFLMRTGNLPLGPIQYPTIGALLAKELGEAAADLPGFVSVIPPNPGLGSLAFASSGFLGPRHAPLILGSSDARDESASVEELLKVPNLERPANVASAAAASRLELLRKFDSEFGAGRPGIVTAGHRAAVDQAARMMRPEAAAAFDLKSEPAAIRDSYGRTPFGQGCLLARRLVERGVPFVEVTLDGWDSHIDNFGTVARLGTLLDQGWSALMNDLEERGLLQSTVILCMGEFGRTPRINSANGRDHFPSAWSVALAGVGIRGGQAIGRTSEDGTTVEERPLRTVDLLATVCQALGIDHRKQNMSNVGRPIRIIDKDAQIIQEALL